MKINTVRVTPQIVWLPRPLEFACLAGALCTLPFWVWVLERIVRGPFPDAVLPTLIVYAFVRHLVSRWNPQLLVPISITSDRIQVPGWLAGRPGNPVDIPRDRIRAVKTELYQFEKLVECEDGRGNSYTENQRITYQVLAITTADDITIRIHHELLDISPARLGQLIQELIPLTIRRETILAAPPPARGGWL